MYGILHHTHNRDTNMPVGLGCIHLLALPEMAAKDKNLGMPSMTAELSCKAVLSVIDSIVANEKEGEMDIDIPIKSRLLV